MTFNRHLFSSARLNWATPRATFEALDAEFHFAMDACAENWNAKCSTFLHGAQGLTMDWASPAFLNPPYGRAISTWVRLAYEQARLGVTVVALLPSRTDTRWWHDYVMLAKEIRFIRGRLHFDERGPAPFPSVIVVWEEQGWGPWTCR